MPSIEPPLTPERVGDSTWPNSRPMRGLDDLSRNLAVLDEIELAVAEANQHLARVEQVKK